MSIIFVQLHRKEHFSQYSHFSQLLIPLYFQKINSTNLYLKCLFISALQQFIQSPKKRTILSKLTQRRSVKSFTRTVL